MGRGQIVELSSKNNDFEILKEYKKMWKRKICIQFYKKLTTTIDRACGVKLLRGRKCSFEMLTCSKVKLHEGKYTLRRC